MPVFLASALGASILTIGIIEGVAEATVAVTKVFSGVLSDRWGSRKGLALLGYGLAAVQIGVALRLAVVDCSVERGQAVLMANPELLHVSGQLRDHEEASPNLPGVSAVISRPRAVTVRFMNAEGAMEERDFVHLWATSVQHQIDHLNGKMYFDHLSPLKRKMLIARSEKARRRG